MEKEESGEERKGGRRVQKEGPGGENRKRRNGEKYKGGKEKGGKGRRWKVKKVNG